MRSRIISPVRNRSLFSRGLFSGGSAAQMAAALAVNGDITGALAAGGPWPNEPAGMTAWFDSAWNVTNPDASRWEWVFGEGGNGTVTTDGAAPVSPSNVLQIKYPLGFSGSGIDPIKAVWNDSSPLLHMPKRLFVGCAFKISNPWDSHSSGVNKMFFITTRTAGSSTTDWFYTAFFGDDPGPFKMRINTDETGVSQNHTWLTQNVANPDLSLGVWHKQEIFFQYSTTTSSFDGIIKMWLDNALVMNYTDINYPNTGFGEFQIAPVWGGTGVETKAEDDFIWIDHLYTSAHT